MLVTPVMFCTHLLSLPNFSFLSLSHCQMATNYTTLNINIHTVEGVWGNLHYSVESVTDNTLKTFSFFPTFENGKGELLLCQRFTIDMKN